MFVLMNNRICVVVGAIGNQNFGDSVGNTVTIVIDAPTNILTTLSEISAQFACMLVLIFLLIVCSVSFWLLFNCLFTDNYFSFSIHFFLYYLFIYLLFILFIYLIFHLSYKTNSIGSSRNCHPKCFCDYRWCHFRRFLFFFLSQFFFVF
jgi:hypothetical protein